MLASSFSLLTHAHALTTTQLSLPHASSTHKHILSHTQTAEMCKTGLECLEVGKEYKDSTYELR